MVDLTQQEAEKILAGVTIPPRPAVVNAVLEERAKAEPDLRRIAQLVATDVSLAAAVLKTINSPFFGLRRQVTSIEHGVNMLGMKNIGSLVMSLSLRNSVPAQGLDRFWDEAARTRAELLGVPQKLIPDQRDIEERRAKRAQQQQSAHAMEAVKQFTMDGHGTRSAR